MVAQPIPEPKVNPFGLLQILAFQRDPLGYITRIARDYGDIVLMRFGPFHMYLVTNPDYIHEALVKQHHKLTKWSRYAHISQKAWGKALVNYEGDEWKQERRLVSPAFHTQRIKAYLELMVRHTQSMFERWNAGQLEIEHEMTTVTMGIISDILFDIKDIEHEAAEVSKALSLVLEMFMREATAILPVVDWIPTPRNLRDHQAMKLTDSFIKRIIAERRQSGEDRGDVLSALLQAQDEGDGLRLTDQQIRDELMGLFIAGHETTATALTWTLYLLAKHPDIQERLFQHIAAILSGDAPTLDQVGAMTYTEQVILEAMRLYPPAWVMFVRDVNEDLKLGEHTIPKGGILFVSPWATHHNPRYWQEPERFDPDRFEGNYKERIPNFAYLPFGGGPRICVGNHLAIMEAKVLLSMMVKRYCFELSPGYEVKPHPVFTVHVRNGLYLNVTKRDTQP